MQRSSIQSRQDNLANSEKLKESRVYSKFRG